MSMMLYKHPGPHSIHGDKFDYIITDDIDQALKDGWFFTTTEAKLGKRIMPEKSSEPEKVNQPVVKKAKSRKKK